ncbi:hypothetical protein X743_16205 [Mesorhizobium sp. LNHC252B00]|nr:hypothetical protein X743_16205 [Mesorhizobium sp. LNHC252B00]
MPVADAAGGLGRGVAKGFAAFAAEDALLMLSDMDEPRCELRHVAVWEPVTPLSVFVQRI